MSFTHVKKISLMNFLIMKITMMAAITQENVEGLHIVSVIKYTKHKKKTPKENPAAFQSGSNYDYHFIVKELVEYFEGQLRYLGENTEKYITFLVPVKKENESGRTITYKIKFINSVKLMVSSLSSLADNLAKRLHKDKCRKCKSCLEYKTFKNSSFVFKCVDYNKNYKGQFDEDLAKIFGNTYRFCDEDIKKFCRMLLNGVYPHESMESWQRFNEAKLAD